MNNNDTSIIICCAGMGTRLGIDTTKALVNVLGTPVIIRLLHELSEYDDIRIIVGYQAESVIERVNKVRKDVMFAFNYNFENTGEADSISKALIGLRKYLVIIDGDAVFNPKDLKDFLNYPEEAIGICNIYSEEPIYADIDRNGNVLNLNETTGLSEYSCIAKVKSRRIRAINGSLYDMLNPLLPIQSKFIRARDFDTPDDYDQLIDWVQHDCIG